MNAESELIPGRTFLLACEPGSAKAEFLLHFLHEGAANGETCVLVTAEPETFLDDSKSLGLDLRPFVENGSLLIFEAAPQGRCPAAEFFAALEGAIADVPPGRLVIDAVGALVEPNPLEPSDVAAFLSKLDQMEVTGLIALDVPVAPELNALKEALEGAAAAAYLLSVEA